MSSCKTLLIVLIGVLSYFPTAWSAETLTIGSKRFTESYILGEIIKQLAASTAEGSVIHKQGLGNTGIVFAALKNKSIDIYPEYTGTIDHELLNNSETTADLQPQKIQTLDDRNLQLAPMGLAVGIPLGFNDTYALAMREEQAQALGIRSIDDLAEHPELKIGLSQEFLKRADGWIGVYRAYDLPFLRIQTLDHGLAYEALANGQIDVTDIYSTDAKIAKYQLRVLEDNRHFFPEYQAVLLYRSDLPQRFPKTWLTLQQLTHKIDAQQMIMMNAQAELDKQSFAVIAATFLSKQFKILPKVSANQATPNFGDLLLGQDFLRLTREHVLLVSVSLLFGIVIGVPLGILAVKITGLTQPILTTVGVLQTIPSLALLAFLIPLLQQIGTLPALVALFLYALLPIVRNTYTGLRTITPALQESALALGLPWTARLRLIELPLALPTILAGVKTAAVINVGTATIAAFVGAGGYGERIATGLALNDNATLLSGAIPAAVLALIVQWSFDLLESWTVPQGLQKK